MRKSKPPNKESIDSQLLEEIIQLEPSDSREGAVFCQVCGAELREGERVTAVAFRSISGLSYNVCDVFCREHGDEFDRAWDEELCGVVVRGRVGIVSDVVMQSSWQVLLKPELVGLSPVGAVDVQVSSDVDLENGEETVDFRGELSCPDVVPGSSGRDETSSWCDGGGR